MADAVSFSYLEEFMKACTIRPAHIRDAQAILDIYQWYVKTSTATFEYEVPSITTFQTRMTTLMANYPFLVSMQGNIIVGYCYAGPHHERAAYQWNVELSVYIHPDYTKQGIGTALYKIMFPLLALQHVVNLYACITYPNPTSIQMHEAFGFHKIGHLSKTGFKFNQWLDVIWMEKRILSSITPLPFISIQQLDHAKVKAIYDDVK